jgi:hypothetical protein
MNTRPGLCVLLGVMLLGSMFAMAQNPSGKDKKPGSGSNGDRTLVERVIAARQEYQDSLVALRAYYLNAKETDRAAWAEDELLQYHRTSKYAYRLELDVPPPNLQPLYNIPEANELILQAITYKDKGWGTDYVDNQRRAELLLQKMLTKHPQSNKIDDAAYMLGDVYESKAFRQLPRAAVYFERSYQWNPKTRLDGRLRAARLYERLGEKSKALAIYKEIQAQEIDPKHHEEAKRKVAELSGK